jgi:hypothetical protein
VLDALEDAADRVEAAVVERAVGHSDRLAMYILDRWRYRRGAPTADRPGAPPRVIVHAHEAGASLAPFAAALSAVVEEYQERQAAGQVIGNAPPAALPARPEGNKAATEVDGGLCE